MRASRSGLRRPRLILSQADGLCNSGGEQSGRRRRWAAATLAASLLHLSTGWGATGWGRRVRVWCLAGLKYLDGPSHGLAGLKYLD
jgi:hypothetical protein